MLHHPAERGAFPCLCDQRRAIRRELRVKARRGKFHECTAAAHLPETDAVLTAAGQRAAIRRETGAEHFLCVTRQDERRVVAADGAEAEEAPKSGDSDARAVRAEG